MAKKRRKKLKKKTKKLITIIIATVLILVLLCFGVFKLCNYIEQRIEERNAEEQRIAEENKRIAEEKTYPLLYSDFVERYSEEYNVPSSIIYAVIKTESGFDPDAVSSAEAKGLMQLTEDTFDYVRSKLGETELENDIFDPETNIKYGTYYLSNLYGRFGDWNLVYAAYNAGPTRVWNWLEDDSVAVNGELVNIPFPETENYLYKVSHAREKYIEIYELGE